MKTRPDGKYFVKAKGNWYIGELITVQADPNKGQVVLFNFPIHDGCWMYTKQIEAWGPQIEILDNGERSDMIVHNMHKTKNGFRLWLKE